jgi:hypothetical protein
MSGSCAMVRLSCRGTPRDRQHGEDRNQYSVEDEDEELGIQTLKNEGDGPESSIGQCDHPCTQRAPETAPNGQLNHPEDQDPEGQHGHRPEKPPDRKPDQNLLIDSFGREGSLQRRPTQKGVGCAAEHQHATPEHTRGDPDPRALAPVPRTCFHGLPSKGLRESALPHSVIPMLQRARIADPEAGRDREAAEGLGRGPGDHSTLNHYRTGAMGGLLGYSGNTGDPGGFPHLHFQVCLRGGMCSWKTGEYTLPVNFRDALDPLDSRGGLLLGASYEAGDCS